MNTANETAIITGSTGGLGSAFARQLAGKGYDLVLLCKYQNLLDLQATKLREEYPVSVDTITCNLGDKNDIDTAISEVRKLPQIDYLINCAGYSENKFFCDESIDEVLQMINVHISSAVQFVHAVLPQMIQRRSGAIITVSSLAAFLPAAGSSIYSSTKAFLNSFMESIHLEVHEYGIKVQCLCPGLTHTPFHSGKKNEINVPCIDIWMEAEEVVEQSFRDLEKGNVVSVPGFINKSVKHALHVLPRAFYYKLSEKINGDKS